MRLRRLLKRLNHCGRRVLTSNLTLNGRPQPTRSIAGTREPLGTVFPEPLSPKPVAQDIVADTADQRKPAWSFGAERCGIAGAYTQASTPERADSPQPRHRVSTRCSHDARVHSAPRPKSRRSPRTICYDHAKTSTGLRKSGPRCFSQQRRTVSPMPHSGLKCRKPATPQAPQAAPTSSLIESDTPFIPPATQPRGAESGTAADVDSVTDQPLSESTRRFVAPLVGVDPATVRIERGPDAHEVAAAHDADAVTDGEVIALGAGYPEGEPETTALIAHELVHVARRRDPRFVPPLLARESSPAAPSASDESSARWHLETSPDVAGPGVTASTGRRRRIGFCVHLHITEEQHCSRCGTGGPSAGARPTGRIGATTAASRPRFVVALLRPAPRRGEQRNLTAGVDCPLRGNRCRIGSSHRRRLHHRQAAAGGGGGGTPPSRQRRHAR